MGLNYAGPHRCRFLSISTVGPLYLPVSYLQIQPIQIENSVLFLVPHWMNVWIRATFRVKSYMRNFDCTGMGTCDPHILQRSTIMNDPVGGYSSMLSRSTSLFHKPASFFLLLVQVFYFFQDLRASSLLGEYLTDTLFIL